MPDACAFGASTFSCAFASASSACSFVHSARYVLIRFFRILFAIC
jgi:predicted transporter